jgi:uncharacterized protein (TIGR02611 family)
MTNTVNRVAGWVWFPFRVTIGFIARNGKRIAISVAGFVLILLGLAMLVLPGPGILLIIAGLAILATEYVWAERMLNVAKRKAEQAKDKVLRKKNGAPPGSDAASEPDVGTQG